jgi:hypothetical protein
VIHHMSVNEWAWMPTWHHNKNIIDLHGVRHQLVEEVLENSLLGYHDTNGWEIITGNSPYMIQIVEEFLRTNGFHFYRTEDNYGRIILH